jgi:outer membrane lipoprotein-sorting protein
MVPDNLRAALIAVTFGALVVASGVTGAAAMTDQSPTAEQHAEQTENTSSDADEQADSSLADGDEVIETFEERVSSLDTLVMTYETNVTINDNRTMTTLQEMWVDYENDRIRTETETDRTETITVRNESKTVTYDVENNQVNRFDNTGDTGPKTTIDRMLNNSELSYDGRERLDGEQTYRLDVTPTNTEGMDGSVDATVWLDTDTYFPTKVATSMDNGEYDYEMTAQFRNVTLNESIPDDRFTIDVPDDAEEPDYSMPNRSAYDSLSVLKNNTNHSVPEPDVPDAYSFEEGHVIDGDDYQAITLRYANGDGDSLHVATRSLTDFNYSDSEQFDAVDVGNRTGYYTDYEYNGNTTSILVLDCADNSHSLSGRLSKEEIVDIGESLDCE